jgi:hypothetical protein
MLMGIKDFDIAISAMCMRGSFCNAHAIAMMRMNGNGLMRMIINRSHVTIAIMAMRFNNSAGAAFVIVMIMVGNDGYLDTIAIVVAVSRVYMRYSRKINLTVRVGMSGIILHDALYSRGAVGMHKSVVDVTLMRMGGNVNSIFSRANVGTVIITIGVAMPRNLNNFASVNSCVTSAVRKSRNALDIGVRMGSNGSADLFGHRICCPVFIRILSVMRCRMHVRSNNIDYVSATMSMIGDVVLEGTSVFYARCRFILLMKALPRRGTGIWPHHIPLPSVYMDWDIIIHVVVVMSAPERGS